MANDPDKLKRLTVELHPDLHRIFMGWCRGNGYVGRVFLEELIVNALAQSGDFTEDQLAEIHGFRLGSRR